MFDGEFVEGHVGAKGVDNPIAPAPHVADAVALIAVGVGVAGGVEPAEGHALGVGVRGEEFVDDFFVGGGIEEEGVNIGRGGGQSGEVEMDAAEEGFGGCGGIGFSALADEGVDGGVCCGAGGGDERPVRLPLRALFDPSFDGGDGGGGEGGVAGGLGRHAEGVVGGGDALIEEAIGGVTGEDGETAAAEIFFGVGFAVEAEWGLAVGCVGAVTGEAAIRKNGPDVAIEFDWLGEEGGGCEDGD